MNRILNNLLISIIVCVSGYGLSSCKDEAGSLEEVLSLSADNREEMEKVLRHYQGCPDKLYAAKYLIRNMPAHSSKECGAIDSVKSYMIRKYGGRDKDFQNDFFPGAIALSEWRKEIELNSKIKSDLTNISAEYLIDNIDFAFEVWGKTPWKGHYSLEEFCEWILPYRIDNEPLQNWRREYYSIYRPVLDSIYSGNDIIKAADALSRYLGEHSGFKLDMSYSWMPHFGAEFLKDHRIGTCRDITDHAVYVFRSLGFPVATDKYLTSPVHPSNHSWNVLLNTDGKIIPFSYTDGTDNGVALSNDDLRMKGKVYRMTYPSNGDCFAGRFHRDVTSDYFGHNNYEVEYAGVDKDALLCLGVFSGRKYVPVDILSVKSSKLAEANDIEPNVIYHPVSLSGVKIAPAGYPFIVQNGQVRIFTPDIGKMKEVRLIRKFPLHLYMKRNIRAMTGGRIVGAMNKDFSDGVTIYTIEDSIRKALNFYSPIIEGMVRYLRVLPPKGICAEVGEIECYYKGEKVPIESIYEYVPRVKEEDPLNSGTADEEGSHSPDIAIDNEWYTYSRSVYKEGGLEIDFGKPVRVDNILFVPRNDDNFIHPGDSYELFYQAGVNGWISLGVKVASSDSLIYDVPENALLLLKNLSRGKEEQVFYMRDGLQVFNKDGDR